MKPFTKAACLAIAIVVLSGISYARDTKPSDRTTTEQKLKKSTADRRRSAIGGRVKRPYPRDYKKIPRSHRRPSPERIARREQALHVGREADSDNGFGPDRFHHGISVTTSPLLGLRSAFNAADLLYEFPSMNEDLILLRQRRYFEYRLHDVGTTLQNRAIVVLSGAVEGQVVFSDNFDNSSNGDINLSTTELDIAPLYSTWANGFVALAFDDSKPSTGSRVTNSRIYLSRGFVTIGNLDVSPIYFSIGQMFAPFGKFSSAMLTTPLIKSLARIQARVILLGFYHRGVYAQLYGFDGNRTSGPQSAIKQEGLNAGYQIDHLDIGAGYVSMLADSQGMQRNGLTALSTAFPNNVSQTTLTEFAGFGDTPGGENFAHDVPAVDAHMEFNYGPLNLILEYIMATRRFAPQDMTFSNIGANVKVAHAEVDLTTHVDNHPITFGFVFGETWQALALNLPKQSYALIISTSIWKNTMVGIEYRHDINYDAVDQGSVSGVGLPVASANIGGTRDMVTLQLGAYF